MVIEVNKRVLYVGIMIGIVFMVGFVSGGLVRPKEGYICYDYKTVLRLTPAIMEGGISINGSQEHPTIYNLTLEVISDYPLIFGLWDLRSPKALYLESEGFIYNIKTSVTKPTHFKYKIGIQMPQTAWGTIRYGVSVIFEYQIWEWKQFHNQVN